MRDVSILVEDNSINLSIARILKKIGFNQVDIAIDGRGGIEHFNMKRYDIILMDIQMPVFFFLSFSLCYTYSLVTIFFIIIFFLSLFKKC